MLLDLCAGEQIRRLWSTVDADPEQVERRAREYADYFLLCFGKAQANNEIVGAGISTRLRVKGMALGQSRSSTGAATPPRPTNYSETSAAARRTGTPFPNCARLNLNGKTAPKPRRPSGSDDKGTWNFHNAMGEDARNMTSTPREPFISLIHEMLRLHGRIRPIFESVEKATGLSNMELSILSSIGESHHAVTVAELGRSLGRPRQVIQRTVNAMVTSQLLEMADNPRHKRAKVVGLTPTGQTLKANQRMSGSVRM